MADPAVRHERRLTRSAQRWLTGVIDGRHHDGVPKITRQSRRAPGDLPPEVDSVDSTASPG
jgi:hypothetical protein